MAALVGARADALRLPLHPGLELALVGRVDHDRPIRRLFDPSDDTVEALR